MSFSFDFNDDDIESDGLPQHRDGQHAVLDAQTPALNNVVVETRCEDFDQMLASIPSSISFSTTLLISPRTRRRALIPRRALFDIRMQIMAESEHDDSDVVLGLDSRDAGLGGSDIQQNVYEGGFKSWEGATDLALLLLDGLEGDPDPDRGFEQVVELGCGTALPSLVLFDEALSHQRALALILADYNASVLHLVTLPNLLLVWALHHARDAFSPAPPSESRTRGRQSGDHGDESGVEDADGELEISEALLARFKSSLVEAKVQLSFVSGPWSPSFIKHLPTLSPTAPLLILAAETIYQPTSLPSFIAVLVALLQISPTHARALIAAKKVYFGVGGGVEDFMRAMASAAVRIEDRGNTSRIEGCDASVGGGGVGRWIGEVTLSA